MPVVFTTTLPPPTITNLTETDNDVLIEYARQDDNPDGEIRIERSTDDATWTIIASGLAIDSTQYTDSPDEGGVLYYRVIRDTDHVAEPGISDSIQTAFRRQSSLSANPDIENSRARSLSRENALSATLGMGNDRILSKSRETALSASLGISNSRGTQTTRKAGFTISMDMENQYQFKDPIPMDITRDLSWDYDQDRYGWVSNWVYFAGTEYNTFALYIGGGLGTRSPAEPTATIDYDSNGNGKIDSTSNSQAVYSIEEPVTFPSLRGDEGYYRVVLRDLRPDDYIRTVQFGPAHSL